MEVQVVLLGMMDYKEVYDLQMKVLELRQKNIIGDVLLLVKHFPVITLGIQGELDNILVSNQYLKEKNITVYEINRGGDVTYHGPGQIIGYPILDLKNYGKDIRGFIRNIEEIFIRLLQERYHILSKRDQDHPGVWVKGDKITAIGFDVKRWVSMHGFAFNVNTNMESFKWIVPCGIKDKGAISLEQIIGRKEDENQVIEWIIYYFSTLFNVETNIINKQQFLKEIDVHLQK